MPPGEDGEQKHQNLLRPASPEFHKMRPPWNKMFPIYSENETLDRDLAGGNRHLAAENPDLAGGNRDLAGENRDLAAENRNLPGGNRDLAAENHDLASKNTDLAPENRDLASVNPHPRPFPPCPRPTSLPTLPRSGLFSGRSRAHERTPLQTPPSNCILHDAHHRGVAACLHRIGYCSLITRTCSYAQPASIRFARPVDDLRAIRRLKATCRCCLHDC